MFIDQERGFETRIDERLVETFARFPAQPFLVEHMLDKDALVSMAEDLLRAEEEAVEQARPVRRRRVRPAKLSWKDKINRQREAVRRAGTDGENKDLYVISRRGGSSPHTTRRNIGRQLILGFLPTFDYNFQRPADDRNRVLGIMTSDEGKYFSISAVKQRLPDMSRKYIARTLKQAGLRYRRIRHTRPPRRFDESEVRRVLSRALPAFDRDDESLLFLDEVIFPQPDSHALLAKEGRPADGIQGEDSVSDTAHMHRTVLEDSDHRDPAAHRRDAGAGHRALLDRGADEAPQS